MDESGPWVFNARVERVVDGDTYDLIFDLGFYTYVHQRVRLKGVDTAEVYGVKHESEEYAEGKEQSAWVREWFAQAEGEHLWPLRVRTGKTGKYGRWVAEVERRSDGEDLAQALRDEFDL